MYSQREDNKRKVILFLCVIIVILCVSSGEETILNNKNIYYIKWKTLWNDCFGNIQNIYISIIVK